MTGRRDGKKGSGRMGWVVLILFITFPFPATLALGTPLSEISPTEVALSSGPTDFTYDILSDGASPVDRVTIAVPGSFSSAILTSVKVNGVAASIDLHRGEEDRKSTRLNSSHDQISYAVFCLKKKKHALYACPDLPLRTADNRRQL